MSRKYCREVSYPLDRKSDRDDCHSYSKCLMDAALTNKALKLPCDGCANYKKIDIQLNAWQKRIDIYVW